MPVNRHRAIFVDRDGVINFDRGHVGSISRFELIPGVIDSLIRLKQNNYKIIVITNQAGIAKGYYSKDAFEKLTKHMINLFKIHGLKIDAVYFCPHHEFGKIEKYSVACNCRKPKPGMIISSARELNIDINQSFLVGDKLTDIMAGIAAGIPVNIAVNSTEPLNVNMLDFAQLQCSNLNEAVDNIIERGVELLSKEKNKLNVEHLRILC